MVQNLNVIKDLSKSSSFFLFNVPKYLGTILSSRKFQTLANDIFIKNRINREYGVFGQQTCLVVGENLRKQALSKNVNAAHARKRKQIKDL